MGPDFTFLWCTGMLPQALYPNLLEHVPASGLVCLPVLWFHFPNYVLKPLVYFHPATHQHLTDYFLHSEPSLIGPPWYQYPSFLPSLPICWLLLWHLRFSAFLLFLVFATFLGQVLTQKHELINVYVPNLLCIIYGFFFFLAIKAEFE